MKIINLFGGPGVGKSTLAATTFAHMKQEGYSVELVTEYAKQLTWEGRTNALSNQIYVFAKQLHNIFRLKGQVDYIVTDSPLLLTLAYKPHTMHPSFDAMVVDAVSEYDNINLILKRTVPYKTGGRNQNEFDAIKIDSRIRTVLDYYLMSYVEIDPTDQHVVQQITNLIPPNTTSDIAGSVSFKPHLAN